MSGITSEELSAAAGILLSLGFSYIPGVSRRYARLDPTHKRLVMLALLLGCAAGAFALSCLNAGPLSGLPCSQAGAWGLARAFISALIANQAAFSLSPQVSRKDGEDPSTGQGTSEADTTPEEPEAIDKRVARRWPEAGEDR